MEYGRGGCPEEAVRTLPRHLLAVHVGSPVDVEIAADGRLVRQRASDGEA